MALLEIKNLTKSYGTVQALKEVSFSAKRGEFISVIGPSGAGKSTLLRCINRMIDPSSGEVRFEKEDITHLGRKDIRRVRAHMGMIFQHYNLVDRLTVLENVLHGRLGYKSTLEGIFGRYTPEEKENARNLLEKLGLADQYAKRCDALSGGQKQRVGIARALMQDPRILLCDEPIASLDPSSAKIIMDHLRRICRDLDITMLVNLHQVDVAVKYSDRIIGVHGGRILFDDEPKKLGKKDVNAIYGTEEGQLISD